LHRGEALVVAGRALRADREHVQRPCVAFPGLTPVAEAGDRLIGELPPELDDPVVVTQLPLGEVDDGVGLRNHQQCSGEDDRER
jgi:hypothetical protein